jgi:hypothetical protein
MHTRKVLKLDIFFNILNSLKTSSMIHLYMIYASKESVETRIGSAPRALERIW